MQTMIPPAQRRQAQEVVPRVDLHAMERQAVADGAMDYAKLESLIRDIEFEPDWRTDADLNAAYYDGYQKTDEQQRLEREGQPVAVVNLIARAINAMLGQEARQRTSWKMSADMDEYADVSDALQVKLTEAQRETWADMAISEAYAGQSKAGLGWVEVSRVADIFAQYRYRVAPVHRNEIWWDWRAKDLGLSDARWLLRKQWHDLDVLEETMPQFRDIFRYYGNSTWRAMSFADAIHATETMRRAEDTRRAFKVREDQWLNTARKRIALYEVWYRVMRQTVAMVMADGAAVEFNPQNQLHQEAVSRGLAKLVRTPKRVIRSAIFCGPHRLVDRETKLKRFPYIPFWGFRDDEDRSPYSPVQGMRYPQDEYNARRSRLMWLLQCAQVFVDNDALDPRFNNVEDLAREIMRPDSVFVLNKDRRNVQGVRIERSTQLPREQAEVMNDAKQLIQDVPGIYTAMLGDAPTGVTSGLAINSLVEQGSIALGDFNDNYRYARRMVGEALVDLMVEDMQTENLQVKVGLGKGARVVVLNTMDAQGLPMNNVKAAPVKVALEDAPNTPAYRMQQQQQIASVLQVGGNDPAVRAALIPSFIEATDLPNREHDAKYLRQAYGVPQPGDRNAAMQAEQAAQADAAQKAQLAQEQTMLTLKELAGKVDNLASATDLNRAKTEEIMHRLTNPQPEQQGDPHAQAINDAIAEARAGSAVGAA